ncbi:hypothetical protein NQ315_010578, partial [Exocentrus adspersus]
PLSSPPGVQGTSFCFSELVLRLLVGLRHLDVVVHGLSYERVCVDGRFVEDKASVSVSCFRTDDLTHWSIGVKIFELLLKCGWEDSLFELKYREAEKQGKKYKFIAHSSYGCIKLPPKCVVEDNLLTYNLTNLVDAGGYLVSNVPNGRIYLNVCGPLNLKLKQDNPCSKSFSQVCEIKDGHYVNRGSIVSQFKVDNDIVKMTFGNGMRCKEDPSRQYITHIDFICSKTEEGPTFVNDSKCDLSIKWNTPQACPVYDKSKCVITQREQQDCLVNLQRHPLNLSSLKRFSSDYEVVDPKNSSIKYLINICGSFIDPDVSCMQHSMIVMKDMGQPHVKYKFKSLGKLEEISIVNEQIVIQAISGAYCGEEGDYTSKIYLICRDKEGDIIPVHPAEEREKYDTITETFTERENCTITSPYTGYTVALSSLHINSSIFVICRDDSATDLPVCDIYLIPILRECVTFTD